MDIGIFILYHIIWDSSTQSYKTIVNWSKNKYAWNYEQFLEVLPIELAIVKYMSTVSASIFHTP